jgi:hypothetical protein
LRIAYSRLSWRPLSWAALPRHFLEGFIKRLWIVRGPYFSGHHASQATEFVVLRLVGNEVAFLINHIPQVPSDAAMIEGVTLAHPKSRILSLGYSIASKRFDAFRIGVISNMHDVASPVEDGGKVTWAWD